MTADTHDDNSNDFKLIAYDDIPDGAAVLQSGHVVTDEGTIGRLDYDTVEYDDVGGVDPENFNTYGDNDDNDDSGGN